MVYATVTGMPLTVAYVAIIFGMPEPTKAGYVDVSAQQTDQSIQMMK